MRKPCNTGSSVALFCFLLASCTAQPVLPTPPPSAALELEVADLENLGGTYTEHETTLRFSVSARAGALTQLWLATADGHPLIETRTEGEWLVSVLLDGRAQVRLQRASLNALSDARPEIRGDLSAQRELIRTPEYALLPDLSRVLGEAGYTGLAFPISLPLHRMALALVSRAETPQGASSMLIERDELVEAVQQGLRCETCDQTSEDGVPGGPGLGGGAALQCVDLRSDPHRDGCFGMCGDDCNCWQWVCGDCCSHPGCTDHDTWCGQCDRGDAWGCFLCYNVTAVWGVLACN